MRVLVVLRDGPARERAWLGLRTALSFGLAGHDVTVALMSDAALLAGELRTPWLGGDLSRDLRGLVDDLDGEVVVDAGALHAAGAATPLAPYVVVDDDQYAQRVAAADLLVAV